MEAGAIEDWNEVEREWEMYENRFGDVAMNAEHEFNEEWVELEERYEDMEMAMEDEY